MEGYCPWESICRDIVPFQHLIEDGVDGIMMGHVIVDAMRMKAIQDNYGTGAASVMAIKISIYHF